VAPLWQAASGPPQQLPPEPHEKLAQQSAASMQGVPAPPHSQRPPAHWPLQQSVV
jgi:hypothetical protein